MIIKLEDIDYMSADELYKLSQDESLTDAERETVLQLWYEEQETETLIKMGR
jgi:hypothetical protein